MATRQTQKTGRQPKKRRVSRAATVLILFAVIVVLAIATVLMRSAATAAENGGAKGGAAQAKPNDSVFSIKAITVSGDTRYLPDAIIQQSGLYVGESVWSVDKAGAVARILKAFPYIAEAKVENTSYNTLDISVRETKELGVMYADGCWVAVGGNGKVLAARPIDSDRPLRTLYLKGATPVSTTLGEQAMDDRSFAIVTELLDACARYGLTGVCEIDLTNKGGLQMTLDNRLTVLLGNDSNLAHEVGVVVNALPGIEAQYGKGAAGRLDVSAFSDGDAMERAVFTPQELLPSTAPAGAETTTDPDAEPTEPER